MLQPKDVLPLPSSPAAENTIQGSMLLFKIPVANFQNRPLELEIPPPKGNGPTGTRRPRRLGLAAPAFSPWP